MNLLLTLFFLHALATGTTMTYPPLCPGDIVVRTCNVTGAVTLEWFYGTTRLGLYSNSPFASAPPPITVNNVDFSFPFVSNNGAHLVSQISFVANNMVNDITLRCEGVPGPGPIIFTFQLQTITGSSSNVRLSNIINGSDDSTVTIEWTPPSNGGNVVYTITTTPAPLSPAMPVTTPSTNTITTLQYNTNYIVSVAINTCAGVRETNLTFVLVNCSWPMLSHGAQLSVFTATFEGDEITYNCSEGFQPDNTLSTSICSSNGLWLPNPALHTCMVDCGVPMFPSTVNVSTVSSTTENSTLTYQCEDGLFPSQPNTTTCTNTGQWTPNPAEVQCSSIIITSTGFTSESPGTTVTSLSQFVSPSVVAVSSVALFIVGVVGGFTGGALVGYCCGKTRHRKPHPPPPAPLYEDIVMTTTQRQRQELKLKDNVAYGQVTVL